jgi:hypothetical protein
MKINYFIRVCSGVILFSLMYISSMCAESFGWHAKGDLGMVAAGEQESVAAGLSLASLILRLTAPKGLPIQKSGTM